MDKYGFDPKAARNGATGNKKDGIKAGLQKHGFDVTEDTIRKYLNEAKEKFLLYKIILVKVNRIRLRINRIRPK